MKENALIVVAKQPAAGTTKTRLCPPFTPEQAAEFYHCLMLDTLALVRRVPDADLSIAYTPAGARAFFAALVPNGFHLVPQAGRDLGKRLVNALSRHFELGYRCAVIVNSDGPTLPVDYLTQAFTGLNQADVTLGPGHDGGYYLIGMRQLHTGLFEGIDWSTGRVLMQTLAACQRLGLTVQQLPEWYDVDVVADLERLGRDLAGDPGLAPETAAFLRRRSPG
jgi:rSAM/selenodomain-associated transferase 1